MTLNQEKKSFKDRVAKAIGVPSKSGAGYIGQLFFQARFIFFIYFLLILVYLIAFWLLKCWTVPTLSKIFGTGFGESFSASVLEDLAMFPFLTLVIMIFSIFASTKRPDQYEFNFRIKAIMNSRKVEFNEDVFHYLREKISILLAYNQLVEVDLEISEYYPSENAGIYQFLWDRRQLITNMCKDKDFSSPSSKVEIFSDKEVRGSYGRILALNEVDPNNFNTTIRPFHDFHAGEELKPGANPYDFKYQIPQDSEFGARLRYYVYSEIQDSSKDAAWSYVAVARWTSQMDLNVSNCLKGMAFKVSMRRRDASGRLESIFDKVELKPNEPLPHVEKRPFEEDDRIEILVSQPYAFVK